MNSEATLHSYSSEVRLELVLKDEVINLGQIGPDMAVLREPRELPPCDAEIVMYVDGRPTRWPVRLVDGATLQSREIRTAPRNGR